MGNAEHMPTLRVLRILEQLADHPQGLTLTEIARGIGSPKSTVVPIIGTLRASKYVFFNPQTTRYSIGIAAFSTGSAYVSNMSSLQFIRSEMRYVVQQSGEICQFGVLDNNKVLYVAIEEPMASFRLVSSVGKRLPLYCTAIGKSLICNMSISEVRALYPDGLASFTGNTITDFNVLEKELEDIRQRGYVAIERGEISPDLTCVSVPLFKGDEIIAAVSISVPTFRTTDEKLEQGKALLLGMQKKVKNYLEVHDINPNSFASAGMEDGGY